MFIFIHQRSWHHIKQKKKYLSPPQTHFFAKTFCILNWLIARIISLSTVASYLFVTRPCISILGLDLKCTNMAKKEAVLCSKSCHKYVDTMHCYSLRRRNFFFSEKNVTKDGVVYANFSGGFLLRTQNRNGFLMRKNFVREHFVKYSWVSLVVACIDSPLKTFLIATHCKPFSYANERGT